MIKREIEPPGNCEDGIYKGEHVQSYPEHTDVGTLKKLLAGDNPNDSRRRLLLIFIRGPSGSGKSNLAK